MRKVYLIGLLILGLTIFGIGCSDDSTDPNLTEGDPSDQNFVQAQVLADSIVVATIGDIGGAFDEYLDFNGVYPADAADTVYIAYDDVTCWWELYLSADSIENYLIAVDSVHFDDGSGCQQFPDSTTTNEIDIRGYLDMYMIADSLILSSDLNRNLNIFGLQDDTVIINASESNESSITLGQSNLSIDYEGVLTDLTFLRVDVYDDYDPYPQSGTLEMSMLLVSITPNGEATISWSITITFGPNGYHARAESGDNYWEWDGYYQG